MCKPCQKTDYYAGGLDLSQKAMTPYNELACDFLADLSKRLHSSDEARQFGEVIAFSFWCRKSNIMSFKDQFDDGFDRLGLGLVFHIAPSNVMANFAYSFVFGLLSGNSNIVRLPSRKSEIVDIIVAEILSLLAEIKYSQLYKMTAFVRYDHEGGATAEFSEICDARVIWGGDDTIEDVRSNPIPARASDITFADRYSFSVIGLNELNDLDDDGLSKLARNFYNDTYLMDQNACSSPHLIIWLGSGQGAEKAKFWNAVRVVVAEKYQLEPVQAVEKYALLLENMTRTDGGGQVQKQDNFLYHMTLDQLPDDIDHLRGKFGLFYEYVTSDLDDIKHIITRKFQTMTYFGVPAPRLKSFVLDNRLSGIDRITPIGTALDIDVIWDGMDVVKRLSRIVRVT